MIKERLKAIRKHFRLSQGVFGESIGVSRDVISNVESGRVELKDHLVKLICSEFNISEDWLKFGNGSMFIEKENFSLDTFARQRQMSDLELDILKAYFELDPELRHQVLSHFKNKFASPEIVTTDSVPLVQSKTDVELAEEAYIKSISSSAKNTKSIASNTIEEIEIKKQAK